MSQVILDLQRIFYHLFAETEGNSDFSGTDSLLEWLLSEAKPRTTTSGRGTTELSHGFPDVSAN